MAPLVGRLALVSSLTCSLGAIACASQPAETTPAAAPEQPREASRQHDEQTPPPAAATPTSESQSEPAPTTPTSESQPEPAPAPANTPADAPAVEPSRKLEVVARLVEAKPAGTCFMGHHLLPQTLLRYEIADVLEGTYGERELYVVPRCSGTVWRCRNLTGKAVTRFTAGDTHHLRLEQERREWLVELPPAAKHLPPYRLTCGNLVPPESPTTPTSASQAEPPPAPASAPADPTPAPAVEPSRELEVVARLLEPNRATDCVGMHTRPLDVVMRYEIIQVVQGTYSAREVYAGHRCPRGGTVACEGVAGEAVKKFMAGDVHHLRLDQNLERRGWRVDLRTDKHLRRYHVACGNLVPPESP
ncbi:hypothetical protein [Nannocystis radixulma]|uniref:Uncharacterized protein n=1 Tax=Nannocystis radixulma TaxID=2995305 RepID=A0ABT5BED3_9BACT|nr:hypothetical protein [Nannocystis radixulma]MDC0672491.1 hypothetical protein [Nannocystis radixulma]